VVSERTRSFRIATAVPTVAPARGAAGESLLIVRMGAKAPEAIAASLEMVSLIVSERAGSFRIVTAAPRERRHRRCR
jgi:hypothetical protein